MLLPHLDASPQHLPPLTRTDRPCLAQAGIGVAETIAVPPAQAKDSDVEVICLTQDIMAVPLAHPSGAADAMAVPPAQPSETPYPMAAPAAQPNVAPDAGSTGSPAVADQADVEVICLTQGDAAEADQTEEAAVDAVAQLPASVSLWLDVHDLQQLQVHACLLECSVAAVLAATMLLMHSHIAWSVVFLAAYELVDTWPTV